MKTWKYYYNEKTNQHGIKYYKVKLRLKNWVRYLILGIIDLIFIINLPNILKDTESINNYRFNILIIMIFLIINIIFMGIIENKKGGK